MKAQSVKFRASWKDRSAFNDATVELYKSMQKLTATHAALGIERPLQDLRGDTIALTQSVFSDAKKVIKICAYINVIANMSGEQQMTEAAALLDGGHDVP